MPHDTNRSARHGPGRNLWIGRASALVAASLVAAPASAVEVKIGGYVKTDVTVDLDQDLGPSVSASSVATGAGVDSETSVRFHSLQTRFNLSATEGEVSAFVEGDFFTSDGNETVSNSRHTRLRHAYGKMGRWLIGQTWSTFMDANWVLYPTTVDFAGPAGATFIRQSQVRWSNGSGLDVALENPQNRVRESTAATGFVFDPTTGNAVPATGTINTTRGRDGLPDVVVRYAQKGDISWQVAGLFQQFEVDGGAADGESESNLALTGGVSVKLGQGALSAKVNLNANRYTYYGFANPSAIVRNGSIETIDHTAYVLAWQHDWGGDWKSKTTLALGAVQFDDEFATELGTGSAETIGTIHANYRWSPHAKVNLGVELIRAERENFDGSDGDAIRLQFGAQYVF